MDEVEGLKNALQQMSGKLLELTKENDFAKTKIEDLESKLRVVNNQQALLSKREIESRSRAEVSEDMVEKFMDKMIARMS